ncbi:MAG TPA: hypothetical protein VF532_15710 [Candidatus Angelobacter sp.]
MNLQHLKLETTRENLISRFIDLLAPIAKGQRGLIIASPQTGYKLILETIANSVAVNHPEVVVMVLLLDQPEDEAAAMKRSIKAEVFFSTRQQPDARHIHLAEMTMERARRLAAQKRDVLVLVDSLTRLAQAYSEVLPLPDKTEPSTSNPYARRQTRQFFEATRNFDSVGSLTMVAVAEIENQTPEETMLLQELKTTTEMQIVLEERVLDEGIFPAVNIHRSGNKNQEMFIPLEDLGRTFVLRKVLEALSPAEAAKLLGGKLLMTQSNKQFLGNMSSI